MVTNLCYYCWSIKIYIVYWFINSLFGLIHVDPIISGKWCLSLSSDFYQNFLINVIDCLSWFLMKNHHVGSAIQGTASRRCHRVSRLQGLRASMGRWRVFRCLDFSELGKPWNTMEDMENVPWGSFKNVLMGNYGKWKHLMTMLRRKRKASAHAERIDLRFCWMHRQFDNKDAEFYKENQQACRQ